MRKNIFLLLLTLTCCLQAQELEIKSLALLPSDNTAQSSPVLDNRQSPCALIKVDVGGLRGLLFPNKGRDHKENSFDEQTGLYLVYVPSAIKRLAYNHPNYLAGEIQFADYVGQLESGRTYLLKMEAPATALTGSVVVLKVQPADAIVEFDGREAEPSPDGIYKFPVEAGSYGYKVSADNHVSQRGTATVEQGETKTISKKLPWVTHEVDVQCNIRSAQVYVDNVYYGTTGKLKLPQGTHTVRLKSDSYLDSEKTVQIAEDVPTLAFSLKKNKNLKEIHAVDVRIYSLCGSEHIYKNQKKLDEWTNGGIVKFMPGKYLLTDDEYNQYKLVVKEGSEPMEVRF